MNRRPFLQTIAAGGAFLAAGCVESLTVPSNRPDASAVFENYRFEGTDLVVELHDGADVEEAVLFDSSTDEEYETVKQPTRAVRFPVVFPDRLETYVSDSLHVKAKTPNGWVRQWTWKPVHGAVRNVEAGRDGRALFDIQNQGGAPLLVRFVGIYGDVPNPTVNPQGDSFDRSSFEPGPSVIGSGGNRPFSTTRTDLVVPPGETAPFETLYAPFAFPVGAQAADCDGEERVASIAVVHASGGSAAYTFRYRRGGESTMIEGQPVEVCSYVETST